MGEEIDQLLRFPLPPRRSFVAHADHDLALKMFGPQFVLPTIASNETADSQAYDNQPEPEAELFSKDERSHARLLAMAINQQAVCRVEPSHNWKAGIAQAVAMPCVPLCWVRMMDLFPS